MAAQNPNINYESQLLLGFCTWTVESWNRAGQWRGRFAMKRVIQSINNRLMKKFKVDKTQQW